MIYDFAALTVMSMILWRQWRAKFFTMSLIRYSSNDDDNMFYIIQNDGKPQPEGRRLEKSMLAWDDSSNSVGVTITLDRDVKYQQIIGYVGNNTIEEKC